MKTKGSRFWILSGVAACFVFVVLDGVSNFWFGMHIPKYHWLHDSISRLGQPGSPYENAVTIWGFFFTILLLLFANAFRLVFSPHLTIRLATLGLCVYALGEGIGSGLFPIDPLTASATLSGMLHEVFSGIGDAGIVLLPFILYRAPDFSRNRKIKQYFIVVSCIGLGCLSLFLSAKFFPELPHISHLKGLWQRIYTLNYHLMLIVLNLRMLTIVCSERPSIQV